MKAVRDEETETDVWYRATFTIDNPSTRYRWLLSGGSAGYAWVNGLDVIRHDVADADDFILTTDPGGPDWHLGSVAYEIFPDRFASSGRADAPAWAVRRAWDELPTGRGRATPHELYGGDLGGIEARLGHIEGLGADLLYLTPFFPAGSTHRYDASSFDHVDPLLGGDEALASLVRAAHARGMRVIGDLTLNHSGSGHDWFTSEQDYYYFDEALPGGYASWFGVKSLPKLNWGSAELRERDAGDRPALARRRARRLADRRREHDRTPPRLRPHPRGGACHPRRARPEHLLVAEHGHDFRNDLAGGGWHGTMNTDLNSAGAMTQPTRQPVTEYVFDIALMVDRAVVHARGASPAGCARRRTGCARRSRR